MAVYFVISHDGLLIGFSGTKIGVTEPLPEWQHMSITTHLYFYQSYLIAAVCLKVSLDTGFLQNLNNSYGARMAISVQNVLIILPSLLPSLSSRMQYILICRMMGFFQNLIESIGTGMKVQELILYNIHLCSKYSNYTLDLISLLQYFLMCRMMGFF